MAETISVEKSFELPTDKDWEYLDNELINNIRISDDIFQKYKDNILMYPRLQECIFGFNNKIGLLCITYE